MAKSKKNTKSKRDMYDEGLAESHKESYRSRDSGTGATIWNELAANATFWNCPEGDHIIDIIPYLAGENYPTTTGRKPGKAVYFLDIWVHKGVGPNGDQFVCPAKNYKKRCPICEEIERKIEEAGDYEQVRKFVERYRAKRRSIYNVVVRDDGKEERKGVQIWDVAHFFMEKHLAKKSKDPRTGGYTFFSHPDKGKNVYFEKRGKRNQSFENHQFLDREKPVSDEELESAWVLDEMIHIPTYNEIAEVFNMADEDEEEGEAQEDGSTGDDEYEDADTGRQVGGRTASSKEEDEPEQEPEEKPAVSERRRKRQERKKKEEKADPENPCPAGHRFGIDIDRKPECNNCEKWDPCADKADELEGAS